MLLSHYHPHVKGQQTFSKSEKKITKASKKSLKVYKIYYFGAEFGTGYLIDLGIWAAKKDYETYLS
jgi:hypothetical protein